MKCVFYSGDNTWLRNTSTGGAVQRYAAKCTDQGMYLVNWCMSIIVIKYWKILLIFVNLLISIGTISTTTVAPGPSPGTV